MDTNWLEDFVCFARTLSFTRAATERHVTQSAFSRRIKSLEIWVGTPLIDRSRYPAKLTEAGDEFLPIAKGIVRQLLETRDDLRARDVGGLRFYSFAAPHTISTNRLAPILRRLEEGNRRIRTRVMSDNYHACSQFLSEGLCDFLICYRHPKVSLSLDEQLFARLDIGSERLIPVAKADDDGQALWQLPGSRRELIPYLSYAQGAFLRSVVDLTLKGRKAWLDLRHVDAFAEALKSMAMLGTGIAWLPERSVADNPTLARAGGRDWDAQLTLSIFTETGRLDAIGRDLWRFFEQQAAARVATAIGPADP